MCRWYCWKIGIQRLIFIALCILLILYSFSMEIDTFLVVEQRWKPYDIYSSAFSRMKIWGVAAKVLYPSTCSICYLFCWLLLWDLTRHTLSNANLEYHLPQLLHPRLAFQLLLNHPSKNVAAALEIRMSGPWWALMSSISCQNPCCCPPV